MVHFSIDDVVGCFLWLQDNNAESIFESRTFAFAKWLYEKYSIPTTCNVLYSNGVKTLSDVSDKWAGQFREVEQWLKFSFHGYDYEKSYAMSSYLEALSDYQLVEKEVERICGGVKLSQTMRSHYFSGSEEAVRAWEYQGVRELLSADDERISYDLSADELTRLNENTKIYRENGLCITKTAVRLENFVNELQVEDLCKRNPMVIFTHEIYLKDKVIRDRLELLLTAYLCTQQ